MRRRHDIRAILLDAAMRRDMIIHVIVGTQAREGIDTTVEQAGRAYDTVQREKAHAYDREAATPSHARPRR